MLTERNIAHHNLPGLGEAGQAKLAAARILCIGAGGLACGALPYLVSMGIGTIGIADNDIVSLSNLSRQTLYTTADIGAPKVAAAKARLSALNPSVEIQIYSTRFTAANALALAVDYDVLLDCSDNFTTKYLLNAVALKTNKPWVYGAALGWHGQVATFIPQHTACYRCWLPKPPAAAPQNCSEAGVLGALPGIIGTLQAQQVVQLLLGHITAPTKIHTINAQDLRLQTLELTPNPNCVCQQTNYINAAFNNLLPPPSNLECAFNPLNYTAANQLNNAIWLDVRSEAEFQAGHLPNAAHWPLTKMQAGEFLPLSNPQQPIILYCQRGQRSRTAYALWQAAANKPAQLYHLTEGYADLIH